MNRLSCERFITTDDNATTSASVAGRNAALSELQLHLAVQSGDVDSVRSLLQRGANPNREAARRRGGAACASVSGWQRPVCQAPVRSQRRRPRGVESRSPRASHPARGRRRKRPRRLRGRDRAHCGAWSAARARRAAQMQCAAFSPGSRRGLACTSTWLCRASSSPRLSDASLCTVLPPPVMGGGSCHRVASYTAPSHDVGVRHAGARPRASYVRSLVCLTASSVYCVLLSLSSLSSLCMRRNLGLDKSCAVDEIESVGTSRGSGPRARAKTKEHKVKGGVPNSRYSRRRSGNPRDRKPLEIQH